MAILEIRASPTTIRQHAPSERRIALPSHAATRASIPLLIKADRGTILLTHLFHRQHRASASRCGVWRLEGTYQRAGGVAALDGAEAVIVDDRIVAGRVKERGGQ